jgi:hypothetical protein
LIGPQLSVGMAGTSAAMRDSQEIFPTSSTFALLSFLLVI